MTKVHIHIRTSDGLGTDTKGLTINELSPDEAMEHRSVFIRQHRDSGNATTEGHRYISSALASGVRLGHEVHVAKHNGEIVGAVGHTLSKGTKQRHRSIDYIGSIHPGAGHALLRHVADISEKEGSHLQGVPADERVHRLYSNLARRAGGELHSSANKFQATFIKKRHSHD